MKMTYPTEAEARVALHGAEQARQGVIDQIGMPRWYWWGLAGCWVALGVISDLSAPWWLVTGATVAVGIGHSYVFQRLVGGRQRTARVKVRADVAGRHAHLLVIAFLLTLVGVTVVLALALDADGAGHPSIWASVFVAILLLLGGPRVMAWIRDRASRRAAQ
jgi:hypothetical protein